MIPQSLVEEHQRERCGRAIGEIVREVGLTELTVALIAKRGRMARATFYRLFANKDEALAFATSLGSRRLREAVEAGATEGGDRWPERVAGAIAGLLDAARTDPALAELCLVHSRASGNPVAGPHDPDLLQALAGLIGEGRAGSTPGPCSEELLASGVLSVLADRLWRGEAETLGQLAGELTDLATRPFLPEAAAETYPRAEPESRVA